MKAIAKIRRRSSPTITPQALAWDRDHLWVSSRDLGTLYKIDVETWKIVDEIDPPGIVWAAVSSGNGKMCFTIGKGLNDDRYIYRYATNEGFTKLFACPDFTGSYLSFDGEHLHMSQWYKERILKFDAKGNVIGEIDVGAEICGHTFLDGISTCCVAGRIKISLTNPKNGASPGLIRKRKARRWKISQRSRLLHVHSPSTANTSGPIIVPRARQYRFRCCRNQNCNQPGTAALAAQFCVSRACDEMIVDHTSGLHERVADR